MAPATSLHITVACVFGANLLVAFVGDPLNLDLFPPHGSGVAVGGSGESDKVWGHGWLLLRFLLFEALFTFSLPSLCTLTLCGARRQGGFRYEGWKKKTKTKKRGRRKRGSTGLCAQHTFQIMVLFLGAGHPHSGWTRIFCPPLHLSWAAPVKQQRRPSGGEKHRLRKGQRENQASFVYHDPIRLLQTQHIWENKWCSNPFEAPSNQKHIWLKWGVGEGVVGGVCLWLYMQSKRPSGARESGGCAVSASLEASPPHHWSAGRPRQPAARPDPPDTPNVNSRSEAH